MNLSLLQVDDFAPNAQEVRQQIIEGEFDTQIGPDGFAYTGISKQSAPEMWFELIASAMHGTVIPRLSVFRLNLKGEMPHSWVHSDEICATYASVLYLNTPDQCAGGTAFWRHLGLGLDEMPKMPPASERQIADEWYLSMMNREWHDLTYWEQVGMVGMKFNRFVVYPTQKFHSRYPHEGFGTGPANGRLIWACFFDVA